MVEPVTTNKTLIVPNTGDLVAAWGTAALNPNFQTIDAMFGGLTTISLGAATTVLLTVPATTGVWPGSLSQSVNALIRFTGAQTGSATIQFSLPGFYIIENQCTGTTSIRLQPSNGTGNSVGAIPGKKQKVFYDGTHMDYVDMPDPGMAYDLHTNTTSLPPWMQVCTISPYLIKNGATYSSSVYPALSTLLGSTYGGNGVSTFGVPDESGRFRMAVDVSGAGRVTAAGSGINAQALGTSGGSQLLQTHTHGVTDPGHSHVQSGFTIYAGGGPLVTGGSGSLLNQNGGVSTNSATTGISIQNSGSGGYQNMPPVIISFLPLIKT